jgi:glycerol dehydrogenase
MAEKIPYSPHALFGGDEADSQKVPRVIIAPGRYIQGPGTLDHLGRYISVLPSRRPAVLLSRGGQARLGDKIQRALAREGAEMVVRLFEGECSYEAVEGLAASLRAESEAVDAVIAIGGGKCLDSGKCVAFRLEVPVVICPTIASTDAPCSAVSVMYSEEGVQVGPEFFPNSPALVVVDTQIIADAPLRQFVAGMGDALATYYEVRTCFNNPRARSMVGARPSITVLAMAELGARTVLEKGLDAIAAISHREINEALEQVVEANTLLSGVGFESGGLAAAHAIAAGLTVIPVLHNDFFHGELVGIGVLSQLFLEDRPDEARRIAAFLVNAGLPAHAGQLSLDIVKDEDQIKAAMKEAVECGLAGSEPFDVTPDLLYNAFCKAHQLGLETVERIGDSVFRALRNP